MFSRWLVLSLATILRLLIPAEGASVWAVPVCAAAQVASSGSERSDDPNPPRVITAIQLLTEEPIVYPPRAQADGIEGRVRLRVTINKDGSVQDIRVLSGVPVLIKAALESVAKWRCAPSNVDWVTIVTIVFARPRSSPFVHPLLVWPQPIPPDVEPLDLRPLEPIAAVRPVYPPLAKTADIQGKVALQVVVGTDGSVSDIKVASGHPLLVKAALEAVQKWRYAPMDEPAVTDVTIDFALPKGDNADGILAPPMLIFRPSPPYPNDAKLAKLQGAVVLEVMIAADGTVRDDKVINSLDKELDDIALKTVKRWKFLPALKAGKPVESKSTVSVNFKLP